MIIKGERMFILDTKLIAKISKELVSVIIKNADAVLSPDDIISKAEEHLVSWCRGNIDELYEKSSPELIDLFLQCDDRENYAPYIFANILTAFFPDTPPAKYGFFTYFRVCYINKVKKVTIDDNLLKIGSSRYPFGVNSDKAGVLIWEPIEEIHIDYSMEKIDTFISRFLRYHISCDKCFINTPKSKHSVYEVSNYYANSIVPCIPKCKKIIFSSTTTEIPERIFSLDNNPPKLPPIDFTLLSSSLNKKLSKRIANEFLDYRNIIYEGATIILRKDQALEFPTWMNSHIIIK